MGKEIETKQQSRAGLEKMHGVYRENPKLGDVVAVEKQMQTITDELAKLRASAENYKVCDIMTHKASKLSLHFILPYC